MPLQTEPLVHADGAFLHHADSHWLYPIGRVRPGTNIAALQAKISARCASGSRQVLPTRPTAWSADSQDACCAFSRGRRHSNLQQQRNGHQDADDPVVCCAVDCMRKYSEPDAGAHHGRRGEIAVRMALGAPGSE